MASDRAAQLLNQIGKVLAEDVEYLLDRTLLYAKVWPDAVSSSIFKDRGDHILYRDDPDSLMELLLDLWEQADPAKRWAEMEYMVRGGKFDARFTYPEEINPREDSLDRRDRVVKRHLGDKRIVYPPIPTGDELFRL